MVQRARWRPRLRGPASEGARGSAAAGKGGFVQQQRTRTSWIAIRSRWYLKETSDHLDQAEQKKEDAAAERLGMFMAGHLLKHGEEEGVHYSELFEQYLPVSISPAA